MKLNSRIISGLEGAHPVGLWTSAVDLLSGTLFVGSRLLRRHLYVPVFRFDRLGEGVAPPRVFEPLFALSSKRAHNKERGSGRSARGVGWRDGAGNHCKPTNKSLVA